MLGFDLWGKRGSSIGSFWPLHSWRELAVRFRCLWSHDLGFDCDQYWCVFSV